MGGHKEGKRLKRKARRYAYRDNEDYYVYAHATLEYDTMYGGEWRGKNSEHHFPVCVLSPDDWAEDSDICLAPGAGPVEVTIDIRRAKRKD